MQNLLILVTFKFIKPHKIPSISPPSNPLYFALSIFSPLSAPRPQIGRKWSRDLDTGFWLADLPSQRSSATVFTINLSHKVNIWLKSFPECSSRWSRGTQILASYWSRVITWPGHWPLIGWSLGTFLDPSSACNWTQPKELQTNSHFLLSDMSIIFSTTGIIDFK